MPWLERDAKRIVPRIGQRKTKIRPALHQPRKCRSALERFGERLTTVRRQVKGPARVMFAVTGGGVDVKDLFDRLARREFSEPDLFLIVHTPKSRHEQQSDTLAPGS